MPLDYSIFGLARRPDEVPIAVLKTLLTDARHVDREDIDFANSLYPEAGDFLLPASVTALILDEIDEELVVEEIVSAKALLARMSLLLPAISDLFDPPAAHIHGFLHHVIDCCDDCRAMRGRARKDRQLRDVLDKCNAASQKLEEAMEALSAASGFIEADYSKFHDLYFPFDEVKPVPPAGRQRFSSIDVLLDQMRVCKSTLSIVEAKGKTDTDSLYISGNNTKGLIVAYAHQMSLMWNGPPIITTPGSDFAVLCGLLFECASGVGDDSLAGAINRYARSAKRLKFEKDEREFCEDEANESNFADEQGKMRFAFKEIENCKALIETAGLDDFTRKLLSLHLAHSVRVFTDASEVYGPRQSRISHLTDSQIAALGNSIDPERARANLRETRHQLGNLRRELRQAKSKAHSEIDPTL